MTNLNEIEKVAEAFIQWYGDRVEGIWLSEDKGDIVLIVFLEGIERISYVMRQEISLFLMKKALGVGVSPNIKVIPLAKNELRLGIPFLESLLTHRFALFETKPLGTPTKILQYDEEIGAWRLN